MKIHHLKPAPGAHRAKTRKGRGEAAGKGKTAGRGTKGSGARRNMPAGFEGGQMPLQRRLPKLAALRAKGLIRRGAAPVKILGNGELTKPLTVAAHAFTASAQQKVEAQGGTLRAIPRRSQP
jgi:large subunit ribosomal protein L15